MAECPTCGHGKRGHIGPPSSRGAAVLDADVIAVLVAEKAKPGMKWKTLRLRLTCNTSATGFYRAVRGEKVSVPMQKACNELAQLLRNYQRPVEVG